MLFGLNKGLLAISHFNKGGIEGGFFFLTPLEPLNKLYELKKKLGE
jgi:hypothetical protein